jgi:dephospho-CoA kinase
MNTHAPLDAEAATLCHRLVGTVLRAPLVAVLRGVLPDAVATSLGWPPAPSWLRRMLRLALRTRSRLVNGWQRLRPPRSSRFYSQRPTPSYGVRFQLDQLGPPALLERLNRPRWSGQQRRIGLTGGIASGKSSVGQLLAAQGLPVLDADLYAREALAPGSPGALAVLARYGEAVRAGSGGASGGAEAQPNSIDRAALGRIVFTDGAERQWLERLVHPLVRERFAAELERLAEAPVVVLMVPLLFEVGLDALCSEVWLVDCDDHQQLARLMARDRLNEAEARARLAAQWPLARKRPLADQVLDNRGTLEELEEQVARALSPSAWR